MSEENKLLALLQKGGRKYGEQLSRADLMAIQENNPAGMSKAGLEVLKAGGEDLGKGEFLDVGTSVAGAISGAGIGAMAGPVGAAVGGIIGGALGAFGGEVIEDKIAGREVNVGFGKGGAGREALISGGLDMVTLGLGKTVRLANAARKAHRTGNQLGEELAPALATVAAKRGSPEAAAQSAEILNNAGATISPMALQGASMMTRISLSLIHI
jgi:phage tail tape-measure protein